MTFSPNPYLGDFLFEQSHDNTPSVDAHSPVIFPPTPSQKGLVTQCSLWSSGVYLFNNTGKQECQSQKGYLFAASNPEVLDDISLTM